MKGADQCPKCACRKTVDVDEASPNGFYTNVIRVCTNCQRLWEPFDPADLLDDDIKTSSFKEPCNNCAFRPGSVEQKDIAGWKKTISDIKRGGSFYCHKGHPIDPANSNGFQYPADGKKPRKLRLCRGYLNTLKKRFTRSLEDELNDAP